MIDNIPARGDVHHLRKSCPDELLIDNGQGFGYLLMSQVNTLWQLYFFLGVVIGIGTSSIDIIPLTTTARWFVSKRGMMTGMVKVGTGAGQLTIPLMAGLLIAAYGWRTAYMTMGALALILLVWWLARNMFDPVTALVAAGGLATGWWGVFYSRVGIRAITLPVLLTAGLIGYIYGLRYMGTLYGIVFFSHQLGSFLGVWMGGKFYDLYGSYDVVWWIGVGVGAFSAIVHLPIREARAEMQPA